MSYITLDCRDGQHKACDLCNCECHFKTVKEFSVMGELENINTQFDNLVRGRYTENNNKGYTPRHMRGSKMDTYRGAVRISIMALISIFTAFAIVGIVALSVN